MCGLLDLRRWLGLGHFSGIYGKLLHVPATGDALPCTHPLGVLHDEVDEARVFKCRVEIHNVGVRHGRMDRDLSLNLCR